MNYQRSKYSSTGVVVSGGRIQIPVAIRKQLGLKDGDTIVFEIKDNELQVRSYDQSIKRAQERLKHLMPTNGTLLSDELIADRRREAADE
jgi:antitoxin PrlF